MVKDYYDALLHDVSLIDDGQVELPTYTDDSSSWDNDFNQISFVAKRLKGDSERKKGNPWTEEEHMYFLLMAMTEPTKKMCSELLSITNDKLNQVGVADYRKSTTNECYEQRYLPLEACMHKVPVDINRAWL